MAGFVAAEPEQLPSAPDMGPLDLMLAVASASVNGTHPDAVVGGVHTASDLNQAVTNTQAIAGFSNAALARQNLEAENGTNQQQTWQQLSPTEQDQLQATGYTPPARRGGLWADIGRWAGDVLHNRAVADISNALGSPLRGLQHVVRTAFDTNSNYSVLSPQDWARAWDETANGEAYIDPGFKAHARQTWGQPVYDMAYKLATGQTAQGILAVTPAAQQQAVGALLQSKEVADAAAYLDAGHLSEGRVAADLIMGQGRGDYAAKGLTERNGFYRWLSGGIDATIDWFGDPAVVGAKAAGALKGIRFLVKNADDVANLYQHSASVRRAVGSLSQTVRQSLATTEAHEQALAERAGITAQAGPRFGPTQFAETTAGEIEPTAYGPLGGERGPTAGLPQPSGVAQGLERVGKGLANAGLLQRLIDARADTPEKVLAELGGIMNWDALARGRSLANGPGTYLPHISYLGQVAQNATSGVLRKALDWAGEGDLEVHVDPANLDQGPLTPTGVDRIRVGAGRFVQRAYRLHPMSMTLNVNSVSTLPVFRDWLSMFMKPANADRFVTALATSPDVGAKFNVVLSAKQTVARLNGLEPGTPEYEAFMGRFLSDTERKYASGGTDTVAGPGGQRINVGLGKGDMNENFLLPSLKDTYLAGRKLGLTQALTKAVNWHGVNFFMNIWRPLTLARLGFATRVAGEEAASFILRQGPMAYLRAQGAALAAKYMAQARTALMATTSAEAAAARGLKFAVPGVDGFVTHMPSELWRYQFMKPKELEDSLEVGHVPYDQAQAEREKWRVAQGIVWHHADEEGLGGIVRASHGRLYHMLSMGLSPGEADKAHSIAGLFARKTAATVSYAMRGTAKALAGDTYLKYVDELVRRGELDLGGGLHDALTANHSYDPDRPGDATTILKIRDKEGKSVNAEFDLSRYRGYNPTDLDNIYRYVWQRALNRMASDEWYRAALNVNRTEAERARDVQNVLLSDPAWKKLSYRAWFDRSRRSVRAGEVTHEEAALDHANAIVDAVGRALRSARDGQWLTIESADENLPTWRRAVTGPQTGQTLIVGPPVREEPLATYLFREGRAPGWFVSDEMRAAGAGPGHLGSIPLEDLPHDVAGPEVVPSYKTFDPRRITDKVFEKVIGPQINWLSRTPLQIHNYAMAREALKGLEADYIAHGMSAENAGNMVHEIARDNAINETINYVHNPELRSGMSQLTRNISPFWFAQEQFYKRWARTFFYSPWSFRQASLISNGLGHIGIVHKDPTTGQEYFVYPASALVTDMVSHIAHYLGYNAEVPVMGDLVGQVNMLNAGMGRGFLPNYGPMVVMPLDMLKNMVPASTNVVDAIQGGQASTSSYWSSILPSDVMKALDTVDPAVFDASQFYGTQMLAIQYLDATGHGLGMPAENQVGTLAPGQKPPGSKGFASGDYFVDDNGTDYVLQADHTWQANSAQAEQRWLGRVNNWTHILMGVKAVYGFMAPASPQTHFNPRGMSEELVTLMNEMPYQAAIATFMARHPDATAMTVFQTQAKYGGFLPATQAAMQFLQANPGLQADHPLAMTYFIPAPDTAGTFDQNAYEEQKQEGLRVQRTPQQYINEVAYQRSANFYYGVLAYKDQLVASGTMSSRQGSQLWDTFSQRFLAANPIFNSMYTDSAHNELMRENIMRDVAAAIKDGSAPQSPQTTAVHQLLDAWTLWKRETTNWGQPNLPTASEVSNLNQQFAMAVSAFEQRNPGVKPLVQRVVAPELASTLADMAANGVDVSL